MPLFKPKRRIDKPSGAGYSVNWGHPLSTGLLSLLMFNEQGGGPFDGAAHKFIWDGARNQMLSATVAAGASWVQNAPGHGSGLYMNTGGSLVTIPGAVGNGTDPIPTDRVTLLFIRRKTDATLRPGSMCGNAAGAGAASECTLYAPSNSANNFLWDFGGNGGSNRLTVSGQSWGTTTDMFAATAGKKGLSLWRNGIKVGNSSTVVTRSIASASAFTINTGGGNSGDLQEFYFFALSREEWSDDMVSWWMAEPYAMIRSQNPIGTYYIPKLNKVEATLPRISVAATMAFPYIGNIAATLKHLNASAAGDVNEVGTEAATLKHLTVAASGVIQIVANGKTRLKRIAPAVLLSERVRRLIVSATGTLDERASAAITLRHLNAAALGSLNSSGTLSATLKRLVVNAGPGNSPAAITLPKLRASMSGTNYAQLMVEHDLFCEYQTAGGIITGWVKTFGGSREIKIKRKVPAGQVDQEFDAGLLSTTTLALSVATTQEVAVKVNVQASPPQTIDLLPTSPIVWSSASGDPFPFTVGVTKLFVSNLGTTDAQFTISAVILDDSN